MAIVHYRQGRFDQALQYFDKVLAINPNHQNSLLVSARIIQDEEIDQMNGVALERLSRLVQLGKCDPAVYFNLAMLSVKANNNELARHYFEKAILQKKSFAEAHYNLALVLVKELHLLNNNTVQYSTNLKQAIFHLKKVLSIKPYHIKSMLVLGDLYAEELSLVKTSRLYYQMAIQIEPENKRARHNLCVLWHKQQHFQRALLCFKQLKHDLLIDGKDGDLIRSIEQIESYIETLTTQTSLNNSHSKHETISNNNKLVKLPNKLLTNCQNESSHLNLGEDGNYHNYKHFMSKSKQQLTTMCLI